MFGPEGLFTQLKGAVMERLLESELQAHLEAEKASSGAANSRNGHTEKTIHTESGDVRIRVPRDREGTFEPLVVKKHQRRVEGFDDKVLALYARGMTTRDIQAHLRELYGTDISHELVSKATDAVMPLFREWQARPLEEVYPIVYLDALFVSVRDGVQVQKRAFYVAMGVSLSGTRDVLGIWAAEATPPTTKPKLKPNSKRSKPSTTASIPAWPVLFGTVGNTSSRFLPIHQNLGACSTPPTRSDL